MSKVHHSTCPICASSDLQKTMNIKDHSISKESFDLVQCQSCHFLMTQDCPDMQSIGPYYQSEDYISHSNTKKNLTSRLYHTARNYMLNQKVSWVSKMKKSGGKQLLDIGTGTGYFANHMKKAGWDVTGTEFDEGARAFAKDNFGLEIMEPVALDSFDSNSFDAITMWHVLEHIHDLNGYVANISKYLKKEGTLTIAVPNHTSTDAKSFKSFWAAYDVPRHLWHFSPETIKKLMAKHGLELVKIRRMPLDAVYVSLLSQRYTGSGLAFPLGMFKGAIHYMRSYLSKKGTSSLVYHFRSA